MNEPHTAIADAIAGGATLAALAGYLPAVAALLGAVWYLVQIWESDTVRGFTGRPLTGKRGHDAD